MALKIIFKTFIIVIAIIAGIYAIIGTKDTKLTRLCAGLTILFGIYAVFIDGKVDKHIEINKTPWISAISDAAIDICSNVEVNDSIKKAEDAFTEKGYSAAMTIINDALTKYPDNGKLKKELEKYKKYEPVALSSYEQLKNTTKGEVNQGTYVNDYTEDKFGNKYISSFSLSQGSVTFALNQKYSKLKGIIACPKEIEYSSYADNARITASVDNRSYIYTSNKVAVDSEPQEFEIDVTGVKTLTLTWTCDGMNAWQNWGYYATIFDGAFYK